MPVGWSKNVDFQCFKTFWDKTKIYYMFIFSHHLPFTDSKIYDLQWSWMAISI